MCLRYIFLVFLSACVSASFGMLSGPAALLFFSFFMTVSSSFFVKGSVWFFSVFSLFCLFILIMLSLCCLYCALFCLAW